MRAYPVAPWHSRQVTAARMQRRIGSCPPRLITLHSRRERKSTNQNVSVSTSTASTPKSPRIGLSRCQSRVGGVRPRRLVLLPPDLALDLALDLAQPRDDEARHSLGAI
eukprot:4972962-Pleurochrysis_carterae.AAC.4